MLRAGGPDEKEQLACAMHKLKVVVHEVVSPAGLSEAKDAPGTSESETFHGPAEVKKPNRTDEGAMGSNKGRKMDFFSFHQGFKNYYY